MAQTEPQDSAPGDSTRERLLSAAARLFAERGRDEVSIRDIATAAGVRHGNINYHFRTKDDLYHEVLLRFGPPAHLEGAFPNKLPQDLEPEQARQLFIGLIERIVEFEVGPLDPIATGLMRGELLREEGPNERLFQEVIRPRLSAMAELIGQMYPDLAKGERELAAFNTMSQCVFLRVARTVALRFLGASEFDAELTRLAAQRIIATSLHGLGRSAQEASA